jgi:hypothetical protein
MFLGISTNTGDPRPFVAAESARMAELQAAGVITQVLLKADWSGAVVLLATDDAAAARHALDSLPMVANGITSFEVTEVVNAPAGVDAQQ